MASEPGTRKLWLWIVLIAFTVITMIVLSELLLRLTMQEPWRTRVGRHSIVWHQPDSELGWRNKPGVHSIPPYSPSGPRVIMTFLEDGSRKTRETSSSDARKQVYLLGGSFTQGFAISDWETFAWKLQSKYPRYDFKNFGTGAYGTYQSLLLLEELLRSNKPPDKVIYFFIGHHEYRNVGSASWLRQLLAYKGQALTPFATIGADGSLIRHEPESYPWNSIGEISALARLLIHKYTSFRLRGRKAQRQLVTELLLREMKDLAVKHRSEFAVVMLTGTRELQSRYKNFFEESNIAFVNCAFPLTDDKRVKGENRHPNGIMTTIYAQCIDDSIRF
jgi:hypothetical protein